VDTQDISSIRLPNQGVEMFQMKFTVFHLNAFSQKLPVFCRVWRLLLWCTLQSVDASCSTLLIQNSWSNIQKLQLSYDNMFGMARFVSIVITLETQFRRCSVQILAETLVILTGFLWLSSVSPGTCKNITFVGPQLFLSKSFTVYLLSYHFIMYSLDTECVLKLTQNKICVGC
jgi:hypothetical protein